MWLVLVANVQRTYRSSFTPGNVTLHGAICVYSDAFGGAYELVERRCVMCVQQFVESQMLTTQYNATETCY